MKRCLIITLLISVMTAITAQHLTRIEIIIPDIPPFKTLKGDFHTHTVFSDGKVWPEVRVQEAWHEGLDIISITDHIEYHPHNTNVNANNNRSYELAKPVADKYNIILVKGTEITRNMPPGHLNALFIEDCEKLNIKDSLAAIKVANDQGGFVFWNHPSYPHPENISVWSDLHEQLFQHRQFQGIEVVNAENYYPEAHQWCIDKGLTMLGNSDIHNPINFDYEWSSTSHKRPITLVFARQNSQEAVHEALSKGRTAVLWKDKLIGTEMFLAPIFKEALKIQHVFVDKGSMNDKWFAQIKNTTSVPLLLEIPVNQLGFSVSSHITIPPLSMINIEIEDIKSGTTNIEIPCKVVNYWIKPNTPLTSTIKIQ